jgi:hypothetical protein
LVVRGFVDEATLALAFGALGAELMHAMFALLTLPLRVTTALYRGMVKPLGRKFVDRLLGDRAALMVTQHLRPWLFALAMLALIASVLMWVRPLQGASATGPGLAWYVLPSVALALLLIGGGCLAIHGRELLLHGLGLMVTTDSVPDAQGGLDVVTLNPQTAGVAGLRHSLYDHPDCPALIAAWICHPTDRRSGPTLQDVPCRRSPSTLPDAS